MSNLRTFDWYDLDIEKYALEETMEKNKITEPSILVLGSSGDLVAHLVNENLCKIEVVDENEIQLCLCEFKVFILQDRYWTSKEKTAIFSGEASDKNMNEIYKRLQNYYLINRHMNDNLLYFWNANKKILQYGIWNVDNFFSLFSENRHNKYDFTTTMSYKNLSNKYGNTFFRTRFLHDYKPSKYFLDVYEKHFAKPNQWTNMIFQGNISNLFRYPLYDAFPSRLLKNNNLLTFYMEDEESEIKYTTANIFKYLKNLSETKLFHFISLGNITDDLDEQQLNKLFTQLKSHMFPRARILVRRMLGDFELRPIIMKHFVPLELDRPYFYDRTHLYQEVILAYRK